MQTFHPPSSLKYPWSGLSAVVGAAMGGVDAWLDIRALSWGTRHRSNGWAEGEPGGGGLRAQVHTESQSGVLGHL